MDLKTIPEEGVCAWYYKPGLAKSPCLRGGTHTVVGSMVILSDGFLDIYAALLLGQRSFFDNWVIVNAEINKWLKS